MKSRELTSEPGSAPRRRGRRLLFPSGDRRIPEIDLDDAMHNTILEIEEEFAGWGEEEQLEE